MAFFIVVVMLNAVAMQTYANDKVTTGSGGTLTFIDKLLDNLVDIFYPRAFMIQFRDHSDLEYLTLGRSMHLAIRPCASRQDSRLEVRRGDIASVPRGVCNDMCGTLCDKASLEDTDTPLANAESLSRRNAGIAAVLMPGSIAALTTPALALVDEQAGNGFFDGAKGLKYRDISLGSGGVPPTGSVLDLNYNLNLASSGAIISEGKYASIVDVTDASLIRGWEVALRGDGKMPPMQVGGMRKVIIPPELAYGELGARSRPPFRLISIPPDSTLELTIEIVSAGDGYSKGPAGLEFRDFTVGTGDIPMEGDIVETNYIVDLAIAGSKLDLAVPPRYPSGTLRSKLSTVDIGRAFVYTTGKGRVIQGWDLAVLGAGEMPPMRVGGTRKVIIPPELGYGSEGKRCRGGQVIRQCEVRPDTPLALTIDLVAVERRVEAPEASDGKPNAA